MTAPISHKVVLVVEDEPLVRELSVWELQEAGYDVIEATTAVDALAILTSGVVVTLIFTDVNMPGDLDGLALAKLVREGWPHVCLIVTSGGGQVAPSDIQPPARFISKPYRLEQVLSAVRDMAGFPEGRAHDGLARASPAGFTV